MDDDVLLGHVGVNKFDRDRAFRFEILDRNVDCLEILFFCLELSIFFFEVYFSTSLFKNLIVDAFIRSPGIARTLRSNVEYFFNVALFGRLDRRARLLTVEGTRFEELNQPRVTF